MKTSLPTICSTACSPLTARLSITMSLYGRRPSVVLSLVICTSLITTPSSDTTSLPMLYDLLSLSLCPLNSRAPNPLDQCSCRSHAVSLGLQPGQRRKGHHDLFGLALPRTRAK